MSNDILGVVITLLSVVICARAWLVLYRDHTHKFIWYVFLVVFLGMWTVWNLMLFGRALHAVWSAR